MNLQVIAASNSDAAIKTLYSILNYKFNLSQGIIELHISHTSRIFLNHESVNHINLSEIKAYCEGFVNGFDEAISYHAQ